MAVDNDSTLVKFFHSLVGDAQLKKLWEQVETFENEIVAKGSVIERIETEVPIPNSQIYIVKVFYRISRR